MRVKEQLGKYAERLQSADRAYKYRQLCFIQRLMSTGSLFNPFGCFFSRRPSIGLDQSVYLIRTIEILFTFVEQIFLFYVSLRILQLNKVHREKDNSKICVMNISEKIVYGVFRSLTSRFLCHLIGSSCLGYVRGFFLIYELYLTALISQIWERATLICAS